MLEVRNYKITRGTFDGEIRHRWVQIFLNGNYFGEFDVRSELYFDDIEREYEGVPVFTTEDEEVWDEIEKELKKEKIVGENKISYILATEYNKFVKIVKASEKEISSIKIAITEERNLVYYALINYENSLLLLAAV